VGTGANQRTGLSHQGPNLAELAAICRSGRTRGKKAQDLIDALGDPLAKSWMRQPELTAARQRLAKLQGVEDLPERLQSSGTTPGRGRCQILLVTESHDQLPMLEPAFVLPVDWRRIADAGGHSPRLPAYLADFAREVLDDLNLTGLSLHLPQEWEEAEVDLSRLHFSPDSAWAALAAGAAIFDAHGATKSNVMVTAAWSREAATGQGSIAAVDGIVAKCLAAKRAGASILFVPRANQNDIDVVLRDYPPGLIPEIQWLSNELGEPRHTIARLLEVLEVPPSMNTDDATSFDRCCDYFLRMPPRDADAYYRRELLEEACRRLRRRLPPDPRLPEVRKLVFIASKSRGVPCLFAMLFDPDQVLLLHDGNLTETIIAESRNDLATVGRNGRPPRSVTVVSCDVSSLERDAKRHLRMFQEAYPDGRLLVDLTPGYRAFNLALLAAAGPDTVKAFIHSPQSAGSNPGKVRAGQEELRLVELPKILPPT